MDEPCGWALDPGADDCYCTAWDSATEAQQDRAIELATWWLWAATGRIYGQCEITVEICAPRQRPRTWRTYPATGAPLAGGVPWAPYLSDGAWFNGPTGGGLCCASRCEITLPGHVESSAAILEVSVAGVVLDAAAYQLYDYHTLVRLDGSCWPVCCNAASDPGAVTARYLDGQPVPGPVRSAGEVLACEFAAACTGGDCRLPRRVAQMSQMGTTVSFADLPAIGDPVMALGIDEIDQVVKAVNPYAMRYPPAIISGSGAGRPRQAMCPGRVVDDPLVWPIAEELLDCLRVGFDGHPEAPELICHRTGTGATVAQLKQVGSTVVNECCQGLAWVRATPFGPTDGGDGVEFNRSSQINADCIHQWAVSFELGALRCWPHAGGYATCDDWAVTTYNVLQDAAALRRAIWCCWLPAHKNSGLMRTVVGQWQPAGIQGQCVGGTISVTIGVGDASRFDCCTDESPSP